RKSVEEIHLLDHDLIYRVLETGPVGNAEAVNGNGSVYAEFRRLILDILIGAAGDGAFDVLVNLIFGFQVCIKIQPGKGDHDDKGHNNQNFFHAQTPSRCKCAEWRVYAYNASRQTEKQSG